eukprot:139411-Rhodomonas_salina.1
MAPVVPKPHVSTMAGIVSGPRYRGTPGHEHRSIGAEGHRRVPGGARLGSRRKSPAIRYLSTAHRSTPYPIPAPQHAIARPTTIPEFLVQRSLGNAFDYALSVPCRLCAQETRAASGGPSSPAFPEVRLTPP